MDQVEQLLQEANLPELLSREKMKKILLDNEYGFVHDGEMPDDDVILRTGHIGYHRRPGKHFLSRTDWNRYMDFVERHKNDK